MDKNFSIMIKPNFTMLVMFVALMMLNVSLFGQSYPPSKTSPDIDIHFGVAYPDPYRWMEDIKNPETEQWFKDQADFSNTVMSSITGRDELIAEWKKLKALQTPKYNSRNYRGGRLFYRKTLPDEKVGKIYYRQGYDGVEQLLFDPMTYIEGKTLSVNGISPSFDGRYLGIAYTESGAEIGTLIIIDIETKKILKDQLSPTWGGILEWTFDNKGFLWGKLSSSDNTADDVLKNSKTMYHILGTPQEKDKDFFSNQTSPELNIKPEEWPYAYITKDDPNYIFAGVFTVQREAKLYYAPISDYYNNKINWKVLATESDTINGSFEVHNGILYAATSMAASNYKVISTPLANPNWKMAKIVIPEQKNKLEYFIRSKDYLVLVYTNGINCELYKMKFSDGKLEKIETPLTGTIGAFILDNTTNNISVNITSWNKTPQEYDIDLNTNKFTLSKLNKPTNYPEEYNQLIVEEVEVKGHDGTMIPLSLIYKNGIKKNGDNACLMESYGAYGSSMTPYFNYMQAALALKGVVLAIPHVRGGGEKGQAWYKAGHKATKPNTWKDFNSCAEWLIKSGYTNNKRLSGTGTSAGGILISRAITERPDLYAAAVCNVGCANAMRFEATPNGPGNAPEFGTVKDSTECRALYEMDGVAHVQYGVHYPAVMSVAGWTDPRVIAWQPGKFTAAMQNNSKSGRPSLLKVNYDNGHFTEDANVTFANFADQYAFMLWQSGHKDFQEKKKVQRP